MNKEESILAEQNTNDVLKIPQHESVFVKSWIADAEQKEMKIKNIGTFNEIILSTNTSLDNHSINGAQRLFEFFEQEESQPSVFIVGDFARHVLSKQTPDGINLATNMRYADLKENLNKHFSNAIDDEKIIIKDFSKDFGVLSVYFKEFEQEYMISAHRTEHEQSDGTHANMNEFAKQTGVYAYGTDFSIDSLFYNPRTSVVVDLVGGLEDIKNREVSFVGDPQKRIDEDKTRMLQYVRLLNSTGFNEDKLAKDVILKHANEITEVRSKINIQNELKLILCPGKIYEGMRNLSEYGLLQALLPELHIKKLGQTSMSLSNDADYETVLASIFSDQINSKIAESLMTRLQYKKEQINKVVWLMNKREDIFDFRSLSEASAIELINSPFFKQLMCLAKARALANSHIKGFYKLQQRVRDIKIYMDKNSKHLSELKRTINGNLVMQRLKLIESNENKTKTKNTKFVRKILDKTWERVYNEHCLSTKEAIEIIDDVIQKTGR